jgi:hypothetical protein
LIKTKRLGRSGLELSPFGLLAGAEYSAPSPPGLANWCDIPVELDEAGWSRVARCLDSEQCHLLARMAAPAPERVMLARCTDLLARTHRKAIDVWQMPVAAERVAAREAIRLMIHLREAGQIRFFGLRVKSLADAVWAVQHTPIHCLTLDAAYDAAGWTELLKAASEEDTGILATAQTAGHDVARARDLLASTSIAAFSWPARLSF